MSAPTCTKCGLPYVPGSSACPRCGAEDGAAPAKSGMSTGAVVAVTLAVVLFIGLLLGGIVAAIAIPSFVRTRAAANEATAVSLPSAGRVRRGRLSARSSAIRAPPRARGGGPRLADHSRRRDDEWLPMARGRRRHRHVRACARRRKRAERRPILQRHGGLRDSLRRWSECAGWNVRTGFRSLGMTVFLVKRPIR